MYFWS